jgi:aspartyl-tRNA(Asn)/glutamyl-tRNA(Gln) amidotransferase subunit C
MTIGAAEVRHVAQLAELAVADADLPLLADQLAAIVDFVAQLDAIDLPGDVAAVTLGPAATPLRADVVAPIAMTLTPAEMAPVFQQGFFVVPRLGGMSGE